MADPYKILGVARDADPEDIRAAYRKAALKCHPDNRRGDPRGSAREFLELTEAYRSVSRRLGRDAWAGGRTLKPRDFALRNFGWHFHASTAAGPMEENQFRYQPDAEKLSCATLDEPRVFVFFWVLAVAIAVAVAYFMVKLGMMGEFYGQRGVADIVGMLFLPLVVYAMVVAAGVVVVLLTRNVVHLACRLVFCARPALPAPKKRESTSI